MMTLIRGKFFKDGIPTPVEFGNKEQIKLTNYKNDLMKRHTLQQYMEARLSFSYSLSLDYESGKIRSDGVRYYATKETRTTQGGCLFYLSLRTCQMGRKQFY